MKRLEIKIGDRTYFLKFGYGCFRHLAETWNVPGLSGIIERFSSVKDEGDISFDQMQLFIDLASSAVYSNGDQEEIEAFDADGFGDTFLKNPGLITEMVAHFMDSLPKPDMGKKKAVKAKPDLQN